MAAVVSLMTVPVASWALPLLPGLQSGLSQLTCVKLEPHCGGYKYPPIPSTTLRFDSFSKIHPVALAVSSGFVGIFVGI